MYRLMNALKEMETLTIDRENCYVDIVKDVWEYGEVHEKDIREFDSWEEFINHVGFPSVTTPIEEWDYMENEETGLVDYIIIYVK